MRKWGDPKRGKGEESRGRKQKKPVENSINLLKSIRYHEINELQVHISTTTCGNPVEITPEDQGITPLELLNALISMCEGEIS